MQRWRTGGDEAVELESELRWCGGRCGAVLRGMCGREIEDMGGKRKSTSETGEGML